MVIEQSLMKGIKSIGGLTHGRGITENTLMRWTTVAQYAQKLLKQLKYLPAPIMYRLSSI